MFVKSYTLIDTFFNREMQRKRDRNQSLANVPKPIQNKEMENLVSKTTTTPDATVEEEEDAWMALEVNQTTEVMDTVKKKRAYVRKTVKNEKQGVSGSRKNKE